MNATSPRHGADSREACRNVVEALGPKPLTGRMGLRWEVATTVLHFNVIEDDGYYDLIPFQHPHGAGTQPITYLLDLPFIEFLRADLDFFLNCYQRLRGPLKSPKMTSKSLCGSAPSKTTCVMSSQYVPCTLACSAARVRDVET